MLSMYYTGIVTTELSDRCYKWGDYITNLIKAREYAKVNYGISRNFIIYQYKNIQSLIHY